ncbi:FIST signal transduction protein [Nostoc sp. UHCC 0870]|uniref:FIST signal transduction protein n=1 Tax=Nostoc sp. UHCC 0870 TaxID=2914041 RepID=UPI001EDFFBB7|nr:FIST N-terminal domain-containing protein [Nostoc sp. UHCC 0870]UKO99668.1 FIST C-terminal domain-containing protein [Nostoc sp. UHCC 0870]
MLKAVVGHSNDPDTDVVITEVLEQCLTGLAGMKPQSGILLAGLDFDHAEILGCIHQTFPGIQLIGGTTDGEMSSVLEFQQDSLILILFCSDEIEFHAAVGRHVSSDPIAIARKTVQTAQAQTQCPTALCITTPESLTTSGLSILQGLQQALGAEVPIVGGTTCDQWQFKQTYQFFGQEILSDALPILLLSGHVLWGHGVSSGWTPVGKKGTATKVAGNVLYEVDGQPALEFYRDYLGDIRPSPAYRLAVFEPNRDSWYMRTSNGDYDQTSGSITFFADIPLHSEVQVVRSNRDEMVNSARLSMQQAIEHYPGTQPTVALFFSCTGRMHVLGTRTKEEYQVLQPEIPAGTTCAGFYTYGEIAPLRPNGAAQFHNETFVTLLLGVE